VPSVWHYHCEAALVGSFQRGINFEITRYFPDGPIVILFIMKLSYVHHLARLAANSDLAFSLLRDLDVCQSPSREAAGLRCGIPER
jgi:hypothetical protein